MKIIYLNTMLEIIPTNDIETYYLFLIFNELSHILPLEYTQFIKEYASKKNPKIRIIGKKKTSFGYHEYDGYKYYIKLNIPRWFTKFNDWSFAHSGVINVSIMSSSVKYIGNYCFYYSDLKNIFLPNSVKYIGESCFAYCRKLENLIIPSSIEIIPEQLCYNCCNLKKINFKCMFSELRVIGDSAFNSCYSLTEIELPKSLKRIDYCAFANCINLAKITLHNTDIVIEKHAFYNISKQVEFVIIDTWNVWKKTCWNFGQVCKIIDDEIESYRGRWSDEIIEERKLKFEFVKRKII